MFGMSSSSMRFLLVILSLALDVSASAKPYIYGAIDVPEGFSPRYYLGSSPDQALERRQSGDCGNNQHSCLDVGGSVCCTNSQYCIVGSDFVASCCAIGSNCGNLCNSAQYQCPYTTSVSGTATVLATCCSRGCPSTSAFKCASAYGGGCCSFGSSCVSGGSCASTVVQSTSKAVVVSEVPSGCTTSQISCASSLGGGCCDNTLSCTVLSNINYCAANTMMATRTGTDGVSATAQANSTGTSSGLGTGAKAGIGAGAAVGALAVIGGLLWFCMAKRRNAARQSGSGGSEQHNSAPAMSQGSSSAAGGRKRQTSDYFGPTAAAGPFTEFDQHGGEHGESPGSNASRGVPAKPHSPGDIAVPVEIDSRTTSNFPSPGNFEYKAQSPAELP